MKCHNSDCPRPNIELSGNNYCIYCGNKLLPQVMERKDLAFDKDKFITCCEIELTKCIGPIAKIIVEELIDRSASLTAEQLVKSIVLEIGDPVLAKSFKDNLATSLGITRGSSKPQKKSP